MRQHRTIVCVDDERIVLLALREQLQRHLRDEVMVETADDGASALELLDATLGDGGLVPVVITDHIMPGIKGDELVARVHAMSPDSRCVMLTGQATADALGNALNTGGLYRFLGKPWNQDDLVLTVREALRSFAQERQLELQRATLRELHDAALDLTANLAASDRYARLLGRLRPIVGADHSAILRERDGRWRAVAVSADSAGFAPSDDAPADLTRAWSAAASSGEVTRQGAASASRWLWGIDAAADEVVVPLRFEDGHAGALVLGARKARAFHEVDDERLNAAGALAAAAMHTAELVDALEESNARRQRVAQELVRQANTLQAGVLHGASPAMQRLRARISSVAVQPASQRVLVIGQAGSGREAVARAIHAESARADRPLIVVDCAMIHSAPELGRTLELALGGTLFLHGLEHLHTAAARALEQVIGGPAARATDVRAIAATASRQSLPPALQGWQSATVVDVPALSERLDDVPAMAELFLKLHGSRLARGALSLSEPSIQRLRAYAWPGNVRELENVIERAVLKSRDDEVDVDEALVEAGHALGSYTLIEQLGAGGMGEVWRARHKHLRRPAAIKLIQDRTREGLTPKTIQRFRREAEATARLRSPHTVELYDFGITEGSGFYYVMELLEGMDLDELVRRHGPLEPERVVYLLEQVLLSLMEAHEAGLVHRDIKPANIFVCRLGTDHDFVKVLDFGLVTELDGHLTDRSESDLVSGTPEFMAPEHSAADDVDGRADLYALGCVAFWMLTGERVFTGRALSALLVAHATKTPDPPSKRLGRPLPDGLDAWVLRLLSKSPDARPATAREAHRALTALELPPPWSRARAEAWWANAPAARDRLADQEDDSRTRRGRPHAR
ncbi:MAG: protein kinase [Deltaproteobacteria bacterium]|nr:protein kinase [Deltaproteobacteria bacterium]